MSTTAEAPTDSDLAAAEAVNRVPDRDVDPRSLSQLADDPDSAQAAEDGQQLALIEFGETLDLKLKGRKPSTSQIKVASISRDVKGQLGDVDDDEIVTFIVTARVDEVRMVTKRDGDGRAIDKIRRHFLTPIGFTRVEATDVHHLLG